MKQNFGTGKGVVVAGGSGVIGSAICQLLEERKIPSIATYCHRKPETSSNYNHIKSISFDMLQDGDVQRLLDFADAKGIEVNGLVVCISSRGNATPPNDLKHLVARIRLIETFAEYMTSKQGGSIVLMSSTAGQLPVNHHSSRFYAAENGYLDGYVRGASGNFAPKVRINAVAPGIVEQREVLSGTLHAVFEPSRIPMGRFQSPISVAETVLFLLLGSINTTGQVINVDGGITASLNL